MPTETTTALIAKARAVILSRGFTTGEVTITAGYVHVATLEGAGGTTVYADGDVW